MHLEKDSSGISYSDTSQYIMRKGMEQLQEYPILYADYEAVPQTPYAFTMWQYSEKGVVDGIDGPVDLDVWFCPVES